MASVKPPNQLVRPEYDISVQNNHKLIQKSIDDSECKYA